MNDNIPIVELPEFALEHLAESVAYAKACTSYRVGYDVELESISPLIREGHLHLQVSWRRKAVEVRLVS